MLSGRGLCDELITRPEESYRLCCVVVCELETSGIGAPYIYDISSLRVNGGVQPSLAFRKVVRGSLSNSPGLSLLLFEYDVESIRNKVLKFRNNVVSF